MSKRDKIRMSGEELADFLAKQAKVQIATIGKDGAPHLVTMFYTLYEGKIAFTTYGSSQKIVNLRRNPVMTCLVEAGDAYNELRGATLTGRARVVEDRDVLLAVGTVVAHRMAGLPVPGDLSTVDPAFVEGVGKAMAKRVAVILEPTKISSWDHAKMG
ncbi:nitroimidazol reductase NimA-like FMN-containing flavoprotein (pyridoxamine 5'-phosphate oxidase superfamily) [Actinocorallia herbida]|uniref:Nitroimidazol reductase NimA-like FMN-containing flavoprotein (Pyridoxamine 5'-phosphate oxidase superfamily) n=1 Tax=Actinocorallia herbida TaxID=58109 RepID=A0A3N1DA65_9ACTN|nr:pyridoxamine 5'-phosphate oxidase family protein [Actinocorallia herbida]ROO90423.1 nitroimidazol reductase NimA-like FMN-containing flavoprotein (pyridoxamine 5'-phosphate oxidase superfamily) [Actinocorallia herbida]